MAKITIAQLNAQLSTANAEIERLKLELVQTKDLLEISEQELATAHEAVKKANLIAAKKFDEARPEPIKYRDGAVLPNMADLVKAINTLF